jgi:hypothetical protein
MCVCVCIQRAVLSVHLCFMMNICMRVYKYMYVCMFIYMLVYTLHVCVHNLCVYVCIYEYLSMSLFMCICMYIRISEHESKSVFDIKSNVKNKIRVVIIFVTTLQCRYDVRCKKRLKNKIRVVIMFVAMFATVVGFNLNRYNVRYNVCNRGRFQLKPL